MKKINPVYSQEDEHACADHNIDKWLEGVLQDDCEHVFVCTALQLDRLRLAIIENDIEPFTIRVNSESFTFDEKARLNKRWPDWFFNEGSSIIHQIMFGGNDL